MTVYIHCSSQAIPLLMLAVGGCDRSVVTRHFLGVWPFRMTLIRLMCDAELGCSGVTILPSIVSFSRYAEHTLLLRCRQISICSREGVQAIEANSESVAQSVRDVASKHPIGVFTKFLSPRNHLEWSTDFLQCWVTGPVGRPAPVECHQLRHVLVATCKR